MNEQLRHLGPVRTALVLLIGAAASFTALLLLVGYSSTPHAVPEPHPVSALEIASPAAASTGAKRRPAGAHRRRRAKHAEDSFQRMADEQEARARRALRAARKRRLGLAPTPHRLAARAPVGGTTAPPRVAAATQTTPPTTTAPSATSSTPSTTGNKTKNSSGVSASGNGGTESKK